MAKKKKKSKKEIIKKKLVYKYRLVILNDDTFQERFSIKLSRLNVFVFGGVFSILLIALTILLIAFTPLKEYIPGYSSTALKKKATKMYYQTDSLKSELKELRNYTDAIKSVLNGTITPESIDSVTEINNVANIDEFSLGADKKDSVFREKIVSRDRFPLYKDNIKKENKTPEVVFFAPISGRISQNYSVIEKHLSVDIVAEKGTPIKAVADGTVILAEWTGETGYVITVQHTSNYISVYKHNESLMKEQGDRVKSGEAIATVGSTGELTTGPHLHFELWNNGIPVNPENYIDFE